MTSKSQNQSGGVAIAKLQRDTQKTAGKYTDLLASHRGVLPPATGPKSVLLRDPHDGLLIMPGIPSPCYQHTLGVYPMTEDLARRLLDLSGRPLFDLVEHFLNKNLDGITLESGYEMVQDLILLVSDMLCDELKLPRRRFQYQSDLARSALVLALPKDILSHPSAVKFLEESARLAGCDDGAKRTANRRFLQTRNIFIGWEGRRRTSYAMAGMPIGPEIEDFCETSLIDVPPTPDRWISRQDFDLLFQSLPELAQERPNTFLIIFQGLFGALRAEEAKHSRYWWLTDSLIDDHIHIPAHDGNFKAKKDHARRVKLLPKVYAYLKSAGEQRRFLAGAGEEETSIAYVDSLPWLREHGVDEFNPHHFLRRIALTAIAIKDGLDAARMMAGHSDLDTTYIHYFLNDFTEEMAEIWLNFLDVPMVKFERELSL